MFRVIQNSTTADAQDANDNFYYIAQGSILPMAGETLDFTTTSELGSSTFRWNNLYCNTLVADSFNPAVNIRYLATSLVSSDTSRIDISGFSGIKNLFIEYFLNNQTTATSLYLIFNNDSTSSYACRYFHENTSTGGFAASSTIGTGAAIFLFTNNIVTTSAYYSFGIVKCNFETIGMTEGSGAPKIRAFGMKECGVDYVGHKTYMFATIGDTISSLSSLSIYSTGGNIKQGSFVTVWAM